MRGVRWGRAWRTVGAAVLALGILAGPLVGASSASNLASFSGKGNGYALGVTVDLSTLPDAVKAPISSAYTQIRNSLPSNLQAALPAQFNFIVDEKLIETLAQMGVTQGAQSLIGSGTVDLGKLLGGANSAQTSSTGASHTVTKALSLPDEKLPLIGVAAGVLNANISNGPTVSSDGLLSNVSASLASLKALFPASLNDAFTTLQNAVNTVVDTANTTLSTQVSSITTTLSNTTDPVLGGLLGKALPGGVVDTTTITNAVQSAVQLKHVGDILSGNVAAITDLHNAAKTVKSAAGVVSSDASTSIANIDLLNLIDVKALDLSSHSEAAGVKGSAKNSSTCKLADVKFGGTTGTDGVSLDGKNLYLNGVAVPTPLANIGTITSALNSVTNQLGLSVSLCDVAQQDASADGTAAAQRVSAIRIEFAPKAPVDIAALGIKAGQPLLKVVIDPTVETSVAARQAIPAPSSQPSMPRTGAGALLSVLVGLGLAGTAIFLRRKFA